jgi:hypothetical protein
MPFNQPNGLVHAAMHRVVGIRHADERSEPKCTNYPGSVDKTEANMRDGGKWEEVDHRIASRDAKDVTHPLEELQGGQGIMGGIEKRRRDTCCRSGRVVHTPQDALLGKELRQGRQAKRLRVTQIVLLGGDGQLLHILDGLKVFWREFETTEHLLVVGMRSEAEGDLVPKSLILKRANLLVSAIEDTSPYDA